MAGTLVAPFAPPSITVPLPTDSASGAPLIFQGINNYFQSLLQIQFDLTTGLFKVGFAIQGSATPQFSGDITNAASTANAAKLTVQGINGVMLNSLTTGILKVTTGTGVVSTATASDFPTLNQNTTGNAATATVAANLTGNPTLPNGVKAATQALNDNTQLLATTAYVVAALQAASQPTAGQYPGTTTNDNANAGNIGEYVNTLVAIGSAVGFGSTGTTINIAHVSLTAGDWDVYGNVNYNGASANYTYCIAGINETSATLPTDGSEVYTDLGTSTGYNSGCSIAPKRISLTATTNVYLVAKGNYGSGTATAWGGIYARRAR